MPLSETNPGESGVGASARTYQAGTLQYTPRGLGLLFVWLLGGDFAFSFFEQIFGRCIPLFVNDLKGSNALIGIMTGSIAGLVNVFFLPNISMRSDRHRGRLGRRIPLLLWATPCTVFSLILVGLAPDLGNWLHGAHLPGVTVGPASLTLGLLCVFAVAFHLWNMILVNAYNWLIRDVVPPEVMGRFLSGFRIVGTLASFAFLWWVFPHVTTHRREVFLSVGLVYLAIFLVMCWQVREGEYPPPETDAQPGRIKTFLRYFRECLSIPMYRDFFVVYVLMVAATTSSAPFMVLFARNTLGLGMQDVGSIFAWGTLAATIAYVPMGWICDKFHPIRVVFAGLLGFILAGVLAFFFVRDRSTWFAYTVLTAIPGCAWGLGWYALTMEVFPTEEFGQFSAGLNVFGCGGLIVGNYLMGVFMDWSNSNYRMAFLWTALFTTVALVPLWLVYRGWRQHGGPDHYVPPLPSRPGNPAGK